MKAICLSGILILLLLVAVSAQEPLPAIYVNPEEVGGLTPDGFIPQGGTDLTIPVRFHNVDTARVAISNGYYFSSSTGFPWNITIDNISIEWNPAYPWGIEEAGQMGCFPWEGCYAWFDLITHEAFIDRGLGGYGMAGLTNQGSGMPADFNGIAYTFTLTGVNGEPGAILTMDSTWWPPANYWLWSGVYDTVSWGGPYMWQVQYWPCWSGPQTYCWPQPIELGVNDNDRVLMIYIWCEIDLENVDLGSVRVFGKIPTYSQETAWILDDMIVTDCSLMRFLGCGGFRPLPPDDFIGEYFVTYEKYSGESVTVFGDFSMTINQADVTFDGVVNIDDALFMAEHLFGDGPSCTLDGYEVDEMIDVDQNGRFDLLDIRCLIDQIF